uniref:Paired domain-containing protein n=1 Tax=Strongyloides papillosus TaxID=174720 RepID=A0A0N5BC33_STREA
MLGNNYGQYNWFDTYSKYLFEKKYLYFKGNNIYPMPINYGTIGCQDTIEPRLNYHTTSFSLPPNESMIKRNIIPQKIDTIGASGKNRFGRPYISGRPLLNCDRKKIIELFKSGVKKIDIARSLGVTHSCISKVIRKYIDTGSYTGKETRTASCACPGGSSYHDVNICRNAKFRLEDSFKTIGISISQTVPNMKRTNEVPNQNQVPKKKKCIFSIEYILSEECGKFC